MTMEQFFQLSFSGETVSLNEEKKFEFMRLKTFSKWPHYSQTYSTKLAYAGFFYEGNGDEVICYLCGVKKANWLETDDPIIIHKLLSPDCTFFTSTSNNIAIERDSDNGSDIIQRLESLEVIDSPTSENLPDYAGESVHAHQLVVPKSRSDDQLNKGRSSNLELISLETDFNKHHMPRSTSFPTPLQSQTRNTCPNNTDSSLNPSDSAGSGSLSLSGNSGASGLPSKGGSSISVGTKTYDLNKLRYEKNRLDTFKKWPRTVKVPPASLAKSGFFYTGIADRVMCVFCKGALRNWDEGDRPNFEHRKHFPKCRMVLGLEVGNVPLAAVPKTPEQLQNDQLSKDVAIAIDTSKLGDLGIITEKPKHPRYSIYSDRLSTYRGWPPSKSQTPEQLAEAGFFYAGFGDNVKCFYCNGGLRNWESEDRPWNEHAKWFKKCPFVKQMKGQPFILQVLQEQKIADTPILSQLNASETTSGNSGQELQRRNPLQSDLLGLQRVEEREIRARMDSAMVRVVQSMGINCDMIAMAIRKRLVEEGDDFVSARELVEAVFKLEEETEGEPEAEAPNNHGETASGGEASGEGSDAALHVDPKLNIGEVSDCTVNNTAEDREDCDETKDGDCTKQVEGKSEGDDQKKSLDDLEKENLDLKEQRLCKICMVADSSIVFLPCGHLVACAACSPALVNCPICRGPIQGFVRTFIA